MKENYEDIINEGQNRGQLKGEAKLGYFIEDGKHVNAKNVCVLVVDYDFKEATRVKGINIHREGNAKDVENLKNTFKTRRNCNFRRLFSPSKELLLRILADKDNLLRYFSSAEVPSVFVLYVLSHGDTEGVIWTDHYKNEDSTEFISFTTTEIFDSLKKLPDFESCLKIVNFGPCRGELYDMIYMANQQNEDHEYENSCRITYSPQMHNLVVFYSSVECNSSQIIKFFNTQHFTPAATRAKRNNLSGTSFGLSSCQVLNTMEKDEPLINALVLIQYHIHKDTELVKNKVVGQTPEVKMFSLSKKFVIYKSVKPSSSSTSDAASGVRKKQGIYPWEASSGEMIRHRRAFLIYTDKNEYIDQIKNALQNNLDFDASERTLNASSLEMYFKEVSLLESDIGCVLSIFFGKVSEHKETNEVCVLVDNLEMKVSDILLRFVGPKNNKWIGKPKLFFLVDQSATETVDGLPSDGNLVISATYHSGWLVLVLHDKESLEKLINILMDKNLKRKKSLQEELETLLISGTKSNKNLLCSTLQFLLSFPDHFSFVKLDFSVQESSSESTVLTFDKLLNKVSKEARIYLLSSVAGAGKSTFLRELTSQLGRCVNSKNILFLQLPKVPLCLFDLKCRRAKEIKFLAKASHHSEEEIETWVENKNCMVLLDGYDEISPESREMILKLIKYLEEKKISVWIGTRPHEAQAIQKVASNAVLVKIKSLDTEQQLELLQIHTGKTKEKCKIFIQDFKQKGILENPLYLILVAQCHSEGNLYQIFERVVRQKVELALVREGFDKSLNNIFERKIKSAMKLHQEVAHRFMNGKDLVGPDESTEDLKKIYSYGIATFEDNSISFIHQTFAEFLAAQKYIRDMEDTEAVMSFDEESINSNLFYGKRLKQCREFVDHYYSTLEDTEIIEIHSDAIQSAAKWKPNEFLKMVVHDGLVHTFRMLKPFIKFNESQTGSICFVRDFSLLEAATKNDEEIASQLIELDIIKDEDQLFSVLPYLFKVQAIHDTISIFQKVMEKFPTWQEMIRSGSHVIFDIARQAAEKGNFQIIDFLLQNGVRIDHKEFGCSPFYVAITTGNIDFVKAMLKHGMYETIDHKGKSRDPLKVAVKSGHLNLVQFFLEKNVNGFERNAETFEVEKFKGNRNVFHCSVYAGYIDIAKYLLSKSPSIKKINTLAGESPLQLAVREKFQVKYLAKLEKKIQLKFQGNLKICQWLVNVVGVDENTLLQSGDPKDWSEYEIKQMDYYLMLQSDVDIKDVRGKTPLHCAAEYGFYELVQSLIDRGANVQAKDENGMNAFHFACKSYRTMKLFSTDKNHEKVLKLLHNRDDQLAKEKTKSGKTSLHILHQNSSPLKHIIEVICLLIEEFGVDITVKDNSGRTASSFAVIKKCYPNLFGYSMMKMKDFDPSMKNEDGQSCLHLAAEQDDMKFLQMWIDSSADLNIKDKKFLTALHYAAQRGQIDFVQKLLSNGANANATDFEGKTALHVACQHGRLEVVKCILDWKTPRNSITEEKALLAVADDREWNALHHAVSNIDIFLFILEKNRDLLQKQLTNGDTILHVAVQANSDIKVIHWLLQQSEVDLNVINNYNRTALLLSCMFEKLAFAKMLLEKNVDVNTTDHGGKTSLHYAARSGDLDLVQKLISTGANLTLKDCCGMNALHHSLGNLQIVKYIHEKDGRLVKELLKNGNSSLHLAIQSGEFDVIQWLIEQQAVDLNAVNNENQSPLLLACKKGNWDTVKMLLTKSVDVNVQDRGKKSALHYVIEWEQVHLVQMIIERGADLTFTDTMGTNYLQYANSDLQIFEQIYNKNRDLVKQLLSNKDTILHFLIKSYDPILDEGTCNDDVIRWLVEQDGVDLNAKNASGKTALMLACHLRRWEVAKILLTKNIDVNVVDRDGKTASHHMAHSRDLDLAQMFLENGANLSLTDKEGKNALHHAINDFNMFLLILEKNNNLLHHRLENGDTTLHLAINSSIWEERGKNFDVRDLNLVDREECRNSIILSIINQNGVDLNALNNQNETPLLLACKKEKWNVAELLLTKSVDVNIKSKEGKTALFYTINSISEKNGSKWKIRNLIRSLLEEAADVTLTDYKLILSC